MSRSKQPSRKRRNIISDDTYSEIASGIFNVPMIEITLSKYGRAGGLVRHVIAAGDRSIFDRGSPGYFDADPLELWHVDIRCSGEKLPTGAPAVPEWLFLYGDRFRQALRDFALNMSAGIDGGMGVMRRGFEMPAISGCSSADITCCASRRVDGRDMPNKLRLLADSWDQMLEDIQKSDKSRSDR